MKTIKYNIESLADCLNLDDFYRRTGVCTNEGYLVKTIFDIKMNPDCIEKLKKYILGNKKIQPYKIRRLSKKEYEKRAEWEFLGYIPVADENVPEDEIWLFNVKGERNGN